MCRRLLYLALLASLGFPARGESPRSPRAGRRLARAESIGLEPRFPEGDRETPVRDSPAYGFSVAVLNDFGADYLMPGLHLQARVGPHVWIGIQGIFASQSSPVSQLTVGTFLTGTVYLSRPAVFGFFVEGRLGFYSFRAEDAMGVESSRAFALAALGGWRGRLTGGSLGYGAGLGLQQVFQSRSLRILNFGGARPLLSFDLSYCF